MRHLLLIALTFFTLSATAQQQGPPQERGPKQERAKKMNKFKDFTAEEIAELKTKKMVLDLDLTEAQQKEVYKLNLAESKDRKQMMEARKNAKENAEGEKVKPSKEERFKMANDNLDKQIANKKEMKRILNKDQYSKWEKRMEKKHSQRKKGHQGKHKQKR